MNLRPSDPMKYLKSESGYSLIELIVAMQLFVIVISLLYTVFIFSQRFTINWLKYSDGWYDKMVKIEFIENELRTAKEITQISNNKILFKNDTYLPTTMYWHNDSVFVKNELRTINISDISIRRVKLTSQNSTDILSFYFNNDSLFIPVKTGIQ